MGRTRFDTRVELPIVDGSYQLVSLTRGQPLHEWVTEARYAERVIQDAQREVMESCLLSGWMWNTLHADLTQKYGKKRGQREFERAVQQSGVHRGSLDQRRAVAALFADRQGYLDADVVQEYTEATRSADAPYTWRGLLLATAALHKARAGGDACVEGEEDGHG